jgi:hypothetical protein
MYRMSSISLKEPDLGDAGGRAERLSTTAVNCIGSPTQPSPFRHRADHDGVS